MEFYISPQSGQFYMINVLENQWLSVTYFLLWYLHIVNLGLFKLHNWNNVLTLPDNSSYKFVTLKYFDWLINPL